VIDLNAMSEKRPKVSIIIPVYNSEKFIVETIESVLNQTYNNWELILIDDASTDKSVDVINSKYNDESRIKLITLEQNQGAAYARNMGLKKMSGEFLCFLDSDDIWEKTKIEEQLVFMKMKACAISFTEYQVISEDKRKTKAIVRVPDKIDYSGYLKNTVIGMSTSMIDLGKVEPFEFFNLRTRQDTYLWITLLKRGHIAYGLKKSLVKYRYRENSISANKFKAAAMVWHLYYDLEKLNFIRSVYYFSFYAINALLKKWNISW